MINGTYPWSFVTQIFHNGQQSNVGIKPYMFHSFHCRLEYEYRATCGDKFFVHRGQWCFTISR